MVEIEGTVTSARLRNPHVRFTMSVVNDRGIEVEWLVETNSLSGLRRRDISTDVFAVGENLRVAGHPGRQRDTGLWGDKHTDRRRERDRTRSWCDLRAGRTLPKVWPGQNSVTVE